MQRSNSTGAVTAAWAIVCLWLTACSVTPTHSTIGEAKNVALKTLEGEATSLAQFRGKPVLAHFWATWCATCRDELTSLERLAQAVDDLTVVAIAVEDETAAVQEFRDRERLSFPVLLDVGEARGTFGIQSLPFTVLLDATGASRPLVDPASGNLVPELDGPRYWASPTAIERTRRSLR